MRFRVVTAQLLGGLCGWAAYVALALPAAQAQCPSCPGPYVPNPPSGPWRPAVGGPAFPSAGPSAPNPPQMPGADQPKPANPSETPTKPNDNAANPMNAANPTDTANQNDNNANQDNGDSNFSGSEGLASGAGSFASPGGYIDDAIPQTMFRLRYDAEDGINRFDRASYMFGTWREGSFHTHALVGNGGVRGTFLDPKATGTQIISADDRDQILSATMEYAFSQRLSVFVDVPFQFVHFGTNIEDDAADQSPAEQAQFRERSANGTPLEVRNAKQDPIGAGDVQIGFKYALIADPNNQYVTFQFRTYVPTGDPGLGLGTGHYSVEPGLLAYQRLTDRLVIQGELIDWIPIAAGIGAGNVITYGGGIGYDLIQRCNLRVTPIAEVVGWTVLGGTEAFDGPVPGTPVPAVPTGVPAINVGGVFVPPDHGFLEASGDTIVNVKLGVRTYFGERSDLYVGYGRAVTGSRWYQDIARVEYRIRF